MTTPPRRRHRYLARAVAGGTLVLVAAAVALIVLGPPGSGRDETAAAGEAADSYLARWARGDDRGAAALTDQPGAAAAALAASRRGLDGAAVAVTRTSLRRNGGQATAGVRVTWTVPGGIGRFTYTTRLTLASAADRWQVRWRPTAVHPALTRAALRLGTSREPARRGDILAGDGRPLVSERAVMNVALQVDEVPDRAEAAQRVAALTDVDGDALARALARAPRGRFVPVVTLRLDDFRRVEDELAAVPGVSLAPATAPLAPTRTFARALLGSVGPATAEQVQRSRGAILAGTQVGQSGLQARYEKRLAPRDGWRIVVRDRDLDGRAVRTLRARPGRPGRRLRTTLDTAVQRAAEAALGSADRKAALVAVRASTGDLLAVANRPATSTYDRALNGTYAPGSTFKVITTSALLRAGLDVDEQVACPATKVVDGRSFRNFEGGAAGAVPFRTDFAQSCNTAFISLAGRLPPDALPAAARRFGLGRTLKLGVPVADAQVPAPQGAVARAAAMIGQDRILASPLAMAGVAATVADGRWRAPRLLAEDPHLAGGPLPDGQADTLRVLMRAVVTGGTGTALAGVPGEVIGKSGTAEYGTGNPPPTHAWFIAARDDVALAVLVEHGASGGAVAAPVAARFFAALDAGA
jgi:cell division protein FtsI/penicillin-binding protein 2